MQLRTVLDVKVVDVEKRRHPSKHYVSITLHIKAFHLILSPGQVLDEGLRHHARLIIIYTQDPVHAH